MNDCNLQIEENEENEEGGRVGIVGGKGMLSSVGTYDKVVRKAGQIWR